MFNGFPKDVQHEFPFNGDIKNPEINGINEALHVYKNNLQYTIFSGPTLFVPLIK